MTPAETTRAWRQADPDRARESTKKSRARDIDAFRKRRRESYARNREKINAYARAYKLNKKYGLSEDEKAAIILAQKGCCAGCGGEPGAKGFHVDHCHKNQIVRGLLCFKCNAAIGLARDNPEVLRALADYLERHAL